MFDFDFAIYLLIASGAFSLVSCWLYLSRSRAGTAEVEAGPRRRSGLADVREIFWVALAVRLGAGFAIAGTNTSDWFAPDRWLYESIGQQIAKIWGGKAFWSAALSDQVRPYHYYNAVFFFLIGDIAPWMIRSLNATAGAATVTLVYQIAASLYGDAAARRAAWLVALFPSMILWSALNIRDAWACLAILIVVRTALQLRDRISAIHVVSLLAGLALLGAIRGYMFLIIAGGVVLAYVAPSRRHVVRGYLAGVIVLLAFLYLYSALGFGKQMLETASFETLDAQRHGMAALADSAFYENVSISTPEKALAFLPIGMSFFLFAPFPWMLKNLRQLITLPEMLVWWYLAGRYLLTGLREGLRIRAGHTLTVASVALISVMAYGLVEGNVGTAYRHRAQILPLLLILIAGGWATRKETRRADLQPTLA